MAIGLRLDNTRLPKGNELLKGLWALGHLLGHGLGDGVDGCGETLPPVFSAILRDRN